MYPEPESGFLTNAKNECYVVNRPMKGHILPRIRRGRNLDTIKTTQSLRTIGLHEMKRKRLLANEVRNLEESPESDLVGLLFSQLLIRTLYTNPEKKTWMIDQLVGLEWSMNAKYDSILMQICQDC